LEARERETEPGDFSGGFNGSGLHLEARLMFLGCFYQLDR
jgi:hypothetical protein